MAFTTADLDAVNRAIASGELSVRSADRSVEYRSLDDLIRARDIIKADLDAQNATPRHYPRYQVANFSDDDA